MSSSSAPTAARNDQLLTIGQQCSDPTCNLIDFLPLRCQHCHKSFCGDHFKPLVHKCDQYDESKYNRVAPSCPLCNTPIAIPPGEDPNIRMERHFTNECVVMTGKAVKSSTPHCAKAKCGKVLFAPIKCDKCNQQFCPQHRFPNDHACTATAISASSRSSSATRLANTQNQTSAATASAVAAIKRAMNNTANKAATTTVPSTRSSNLPNKTPAPAPQVAKASSSSSSRANPFSATDRSSPSRNYITIITPSTNVNPTTSTPNTSNHDSSPRCSPKTKSTLLDPLSYVPPPIFGFA